MYPRDRMPVIVGRGSDSVKALRLRPKTFELGVGEPHQIAECIERQGARLDFDLPADGCQRIRPYLNGAALQRVSLRDDSGGVAVAKTVANHTQPLGAVASEERNDVGHHFRVSAERQHLQGFRQCPTQPGNRALRRFQVYRHFAQSCGDGPIPQVIDCYGRTADLGRW
jgi:hypothetical protein